MRETNGITLIALIITIIVILILVGVVVRISITSGLFGHAGNAVNKYSEQQARERLGTTLGSALVEKYTNDEYNENEYLDRYILENIKESEIIAEDIVIVDGWAFDLDRSVPKIGKGLGKKDELVFPELRLNKTIAENALSATITINAKEEKNGINKIEIIQDETVLKEFTYDNDKNININYEVKQNGEYIVKVYSNLSNKKSIEVDEIRTQVKFTPNGNSEYKKEHSVQITLDNTAGNEISGLKYQWTSSAVEPEISTFSESCRDGDTLIKNGETGIWYLWVLTEMPSGKTYIDKLDGFYLDNEGPIVSELTVTAASATSIELRATAQDTESGLSRIDFYVDNVLKSSQLITTTSNITKSVSIDGLTTGSHSCYVIAYDALENQSDKKTANGSTKLYTWERYNINSTTKYVETSTTKYNVNIGVGHKNGVSSRPTFNASNGKYETGTSRQFRPNASSSGYIAPSYSWVSSWCYISGAKYCCGTYIATVTTYSSKSETVYSKGSTKYSDITSTSSSAYPSNGRSDSYWYVYKGVY